MRIPVFDHLVVVVPSDIDENNHANNVCFVRWMQEAAVAHSSANGWTGERYNENGFAWVARRHTVEYLRPALEGDEITVQTWIASCKNVSSLRKYKFIRNSDSTVLATAETNWAFVSITSGRPTKIPPFFLESFVVVDNSPSH